MTRERSIKEELTALGIETRPSEHFGCKQLWRGDEFLGDFSARAAVETFLKESAA